MTRSDIRTRNKVLPAGACNGYSLSSCPVSSSGHAREPNNVCESVKLCTATNRESGAGTVLTLAIVMAMVISLLGMFALAEAVVAKDRTQDVADLASLAGAERLRIEGQDRACGVASELVSLHDLDMVSCDVEGSHVAVTVQGHPKAIPITLTSRAQAGPSNEPPASSVRAP